MAGRSMLRGASIAGNASSHNDRCMICALWEPAAPAMGGKAARLNYSASL
jgi:hypothetical protein